MAVKIRLMRIGARQRPFYRVVAVDERAKRTGKYIELLGTYNPLTEPKEIILKQDLINAWIKKGAVLSDGYLRIIGKAPQRPARKPKKEKQGDSKQGTGSSEKPEPEVIVPEVIVNEEAGETTPVGGTPETAAEKPVEAESTDTPDAEEGETKP